MFQASQPLDLSRIAIARKLSVLEYDQKRFKLSSQEVINKYKLMGADVGRIVTSHERQQESLKKLLQLFPQASVYVGEVLEKDIFNEASLIIALGGDNYFQYVTHFLDKQLLLGINADPQTSEGALLNFTVDDLPNFLPLLKKGNYKVEEWTRLSSEVNEQPSRFLAASEIYFGSKMRLSMSRYLLEFKNEREEHKDSGLIIATGSGSTGWYKSASSCQHEISLAFGKTEKEARFICTETFFGKLNGQKLLRGVILPNEEVTITWLGHEKGILSIDSYFDYGLGFELDRGSRVKIKISENPLLVVIK